MLLRVHYIIATLLFRMSLRFEQCVFDFDFDHLRSVLSLLASLLKAPESLEVVLSFYTDLGSNVVSVLRSH